MDVKKRPEIDVSPQGENIFETIFLIGHCGAPISFYKYPEEQVEIVLFSCNWGEEGTFRGSGFSNGPDLPISMSPRRYFGASAWPFCGKILPSRGATGRILTPPCGKIPPLWWWNPPVKGPERAMSWMLTKTCSFDAPCRAAPSGLSYVLKLVNPATHFACSNFSDIKFWEFSECITQDAADFGTKLTKLKRSSRRAYELLCVVVDCTHVLKRCSKGCCSLSDVVTRSSHIDSIWRLHRWTWWTIWRGLWNEQAGFRRQWRQEKDMAGLKKNKNGSCLTVALYVIWSHTFCLITAHHHVLRMHWQMLIIHRSAYVRTT